VSTVKAFRSSPGRRPAAVRSTLTAVGVALAASAVASALFTVALHDSVGSGLVTFAIFGGLAALSAGVLAWELASQRVCPRCGHENSAVAACAACGYDVRERPRFACSEGHRVAYEPGMCDCGRRLLALRPVPVARQALRAAWLALGFFLLVLAVAALGSGLGS
jgi:ribosomal protein L37E